MKENKLVRFSMLALILFSIFLGILLFFQVVIDDAFIFFKYGYNLVNHGVWSWSLNGKPVEAYTSATYAILSIFPYILHVQPHLFIKFVGLLFLFILLYRVYKKTSSITFSLFTILIIVTNWQTYVHTFSGLETILWCWLLVESFLILREENISVKKQWFLWILCLILTITRPEGAIYAFAYLCYFIFYRKIKLSLLPLLVIGIIGLIYFIARYLYFGLLFPLPFYHKVTGNQFGILAFIFNLYTSWYYLICVGLLIYVLRKNKLLLFLGTVSMIIFFGLYGKSFLVMNFADRFPFQLFFPFIIFSLLELKNDNYIRTIKVVMICIFLNMIIFSKGIYDNNYIELASIANNAGSPFIVARSHYILAKNINKINDIKNKKINILIGDAGVFPHYVKATCHDYNGLTDAYFAKKKLDKAYFNNANADVVLIGYGKPDKNELIHDITNCKTIFTYVDQNIDYEYVGFTINYENGYYVHIYLKKSSNYHDELNIALKNAIHQSKNATFSIKKFIKMKYLNFDNV